jgi:hypothetical protein
MTFYLGYDEDVNRGNDNSVRLVRGGEWFYFWNILSVLLKVIGII